MTADEKRLAALREQWADTDESCAEVFLLRLLSRKEEEADRWRAKYAVATKLAQDHCDAAASAREAARRLATALESTYAQLRVHGEKNEQARAALSDPVVQQIMGETPDA